MKADRHDVLIDVSFSVTHGESVGIIGRNGAGKSTLLALMARRDSPDYGEVVVRGRVSPLLELGAGFHPELTGRENIMLNGVLLGLRRAEVSARMERIIAFSELKDSIDEPVRVFSTGMLARLGFSVAAHLDPEILLIDEVLAVGDTAFQAKCIDKIREFRRRGVTTVFVSHNLDQVAMLCDRAIVLSIIVSPMPATSRARSPAMRGEGRRELRPTRGRRALRRRLRAVRSHMRRKARTNPLFRDPCAPPALAADAPLVFGSCVCREAYFRLPLFRWWCDRLHEPPKYHRKLWEYVYICQALHERGMLAPGMRGLGFGVGKEPLAALFASRGAGDRRDRHGRRGRARGWLAGLGAACRRRTRGAERARHLRVRHFRRAVRYRSVDMNAIPDDLADFDFCWSSCAYEHLGSLEHGLAFVRNSMKVLRPGGVAVHTTEFNLSSNERTAATGPTVLFRRRDFDALEAALTADGHAVAPFDFETGHEPVERYVDLPPFAQEPHLRLRLPFGVASYDTTSIGIVVVKG